MHSRQVVSISEFNQQNPYMYLNENNSLAVPRSLWNNGSSLIELCELKGFVAILHRSKKKNLPIQFSNDNKLSTSRYNFLNRIGHNIEMEKFNQAN